jgi:hypothetical protein
MKTKVLVLIAVLIIALAAMAAPVMAADSADIGVSGQYGDSVSIAVPNFTAGNPLTFKTFTPGEQHINPSTQVGTEKFATLVMNTNAASWHVNAYDTGTGEGHMYSTALSRPLTNALKIKLVNAYPGTTTGSEVTLSALETQSLITGTATMVTSTNIDLDFTQTVDNADPAGTYTAAVVLAYGTN